MGVPEEMKPSVMLTLDKLDKIGQEGFDKSLRVRCSHRRFVVKFLILLSSRSRHSRANNKHIQPEQRAWSTRSPDPAKYLRRVGLQDICVFDPFLSEDCPSTGTVYEIFDASQGFRSSLGGGGRYDAIIRRDSLDARTLFIYGGSFVWHGIHHGDDPKPSD